MGDVKYIAVNGMDASENVEELIIDLGSFHLKREHEGRCLLNLKRSDGTDSYFVITEKEYKRVKKVLLDFGKDKEIQVKPHQKVPLSNNLDGIEL